MAPKRSEAIKGSASSPKPSADQPAVAVLPPTAAKSRPQSPPGASQPPSPAEALAANSQGSDASPNASGSTGVTAKQLSLMKTSLGRDAARGDLNARALLDHYEGLPRFDRTKQELFGLWTKDKSCQWLNNWQHSRSVCLTRDKSQVAGYQTERELAKLLCFEPGDPVFLRILARPAQHRRYMFVWLLLILV